MRKFIAIKEKVFLYSNQITFNYNQKCHPLHLRDTWYKQFPQKKKTSGRKKEGKRKERAEEGSKKEGEGKERAEEGKGKKIDGKEEKKRKGWQEFVQKEREKEE